MAYVGNKDGHNIREIITRAKSTDNYIEITYIALKSKLNIIYSLAISFFLIGIFLLLAYRPIVDAVSNVGIDGRSVVEVASIVAFISAVILFLLALILFFKTRAALLNLRLSRRRLQAVIKQAENLSSSEND